MAAPIPATTYDEMPYKSYSHPDSHPDRMATIAHLFGLSPVSPAKARVLELGCAGGGNIAPLAELYPASQFLGIDNSITQINQGKAIVEPLGMTNLELRHASILDVNESYGKFDYIIAHGIYSWVPEPVQNKILAIARDQLTPNGIAYVSYNTLPGWHMRGMIRDMMIYHTRRFRGAKARTEQARALLDFLTKSVNEASQGAYARLLKNETELLKRQDDAYLYHEHLEEVNNPVYFYQFVERAQAHGLRFLGEATVREMVPGNYPNEIAQVLQRLGPDIISMEQYMDFLRNRMFRHSLLCLPSHQPNYTLNPDRLLGLHIASPLLPPPADADLNSTAQVTFKMPEGPVAAHVADPLAKHAFKFLTERYPASVPFEELCLEARKRFNPNLVPDEPTRNHDRQVIGQVILQSYVSRADRLVELLRVPVPVATKVSAKPRATPLARRQAATNPWATTLKHEFGQLGEFERRLLILLDGEHDRAALIDTVTSFVTTGQMNVARDGVNVTDPKEVRGLIEKSIDAVLDRLLKISFLVG
jgi:methyltransferase-like protein/cyclopropane fatty-acyl-phospholipid synthase-like methyltransferase